MRTNRTGDISIKKKKKQNRWYILCTIHVVRKKEKNSLCTGILGPYLIEYLTNDHSALHCAWRQKNCCPSSLGNYIYICNFPYLFHLCNYLKNKHCKWIRTSWKFCIEKHSIMWSIHNRISLIISESWRKKYIWFQFEKNKLQANKKMKYNIITYPDQI